MEQQFREGKGRYVVGLCFGIEHVVLAIVAILWIAIPSQPNWVRQKVAHAHVLRERVAREESKKKQS